MTFVDSFPLLLKEGRKKEGEKVARISGQGERERERERFALKLRSWVVLSARAETPGQKFQSKPIIYPNHPRTCLMRVPPCHLLLANTSPRLKGDGRRGTKSISFTDHLYEIIYSIRENFFFFFYSIIQICKFERFVYKFILLSILFVIVKFQATFQCNNFYNNF